MKPGIELSEEKRNSVAVKVSDPALFQRRKEFHAEDINLEISFRVKRTPVGDSDSSERYKSHTIQRETTSNHDPVSSLTTYQSTLAGLIAGTPYKVKCEMDCSSGDTLTNEKEFTSADPSCMVIQSRYVCIVIMSNIILYRLANKVLPSFRGDNIYQYI